MPVGCQAQGRAPEIKGLPVQREQKTGPEPAADNRRKAPRMPVPCCQKAGEALGTRSPARQGCDIEGVNFSFFPRKIGLVTFSLCEPHVESGFCFLRLSHFSLSPPRARCFRILSFSPFLRARRCLMPRYMEHLR